MAYLLDTCVISERASKRAEPTVVRFIDGIDPEKAFLSALTIGEILGSPLLAEFGSFAGT